MPSVKNSYPKRAYRRKQRAKYRAKRRQRAEQFYDSGWSSRETKDGREYVVRTTYYSGVKKTYKNIARRRARRAKLNAYRNGSNYRKLYPLWYMIY